jgi:hypothetical protein
MHLTRRQVQKRAWFQDGSPARSKNLVSLISHLPINLATWPGLPLLKTDSGDSRQGGGDEGSR